MDPGCGCAVAAARVPLSSRHRKRAMILCQAMDGRDSSVSYAHFRPLVLGEWERPEPRAGELGFTIIHPGFCHSDLRPEDGSRVRKPATAWMSRSRQWAMRRSSAHVCNW